MNEDDDDAKGTIMMILMMGEEHDDVDGDDVGEADGPQDHDPQSVRACFVDMHLSKKKHFSGCL